MPAWKGPSYGLGVPPGTFPDVYDFHSDAAWRDDERDADADGLANWIESERGPGKAGWWKAFWEQERFVELEIEPWPKALPGCMPEQKPTHYAERPFADLDLTDPDVDGDTLLDGEDDQDNDDYSNIEELYSVAYGDYADICGGIPEVPILPGTLEDGKVSPRSPASSAKAGES